MLKMKHEMGQYFSVLLIFSGKLTNQNSGNGCSHQSRKCTAKNST